MCGSYNARLEDWPTLSHSTKRQSCSTLRKLFSRILQLPRRAMRPTSDIASSWESFSAKLEESSLHLLRRLRAVILGHRAPQAHKPTRLPRLNSQCLSDLIGTWAVWTSRWTQIFGCNWTRSRSVCIYHSQTPDKRQLLIQR